MTHVVQTKGYYGCPGYQDIEEARMLLKSLVANSLAAAKLNSKKAHKHKISQDNYMITRGRDSKSALWAHHFIITFK